MVGRVAEDLFEVLTFLFFVVIFLKLLSRVMNEISTLLLVSLNQGC